LNDLKNETAEREKNVTKPGTKNIEKNQPVKEVKQSLHRKHAAADTVHEQHQLETPKKAKQFL
jgi:hypothetical protein